MDNVYIPQEYTIGKTVVRELADNLRTAGMTRADAVEEAFDHFLLKSGGIIVRTGEVVLPEESADEQSAYALCINLHTPIEAE